MIFFRRVLVGLVAGSRKWNRDFSSNNVKILNVSRQWVMLLILKVFLVLLCIVSLLIVENWSPKNCMLSWKAKNSIINIIEDFRSTFVEDMVFWCSVWIDGCPKYLLYQSCKAFLYSMDNILSFMWNIFKTFLQEVMLTFVFY